MTFVNLDVKARAWIVFDDVNIGDDEQDSSNDGDGCGGDAGGDEGGGSLFG